MRAGKLTEPVASDAMSGRRPSIAPRPRPAPERPPVEICVIMPGQRARMPSSTLPKRSGFDVGDSSSLRTCRCTSVAPASNASCADSICSATEIGTAGLSFFFGTEPVMATVMMQGVLTTDLREGCAMRMERRSLAMASNASEAPPDGASAARSQRADEVTAVDSVHRTGGPGPRIGGEQQQRAVEILGLADAPLRDAPGQRVAG